MIPSNLNTTTITNTTGKDQKPLDIETTKRNAEKDQIERIEDETPKKIFVKIAPKPTVYHAPSFLNPITYNSLPPSYSRNDIIMNPENVPFTSVVAKCNIPTQISNVGNAEEKINLVTASSIQNARPHCPVQLSAAIALSELAAKTEDGTTSTITTNELGVGSPSDTFTSHSVEGLVPHLEKPSLCPPKR